MQRTHVSHCPNWLWLDDEVLSKYYDDLHLYLVCEPLLSVCVCLIFLGSGLFVFFTSNNFLAGNLHLYVSEVLYYFLGHHTFDRISVSSIILVFVSRFPSSDFLLSSFFFSYWPVLLCISLQVLTLLINWFYWLLFNLTNFQLRYTVNLSLSLFPWSMFIFVPFFLFSSVDLYCFACTPPLAFPSYSHMLFSNGVTVYLSPSLFPMICASSFSSVCLFGFVGPSPLVFLFLFTQAVF